MPFNSNSPRLFTVVSFGGAVVAPSAGSVLFVVDLPEGATHVSVQMPTGVDAHKFSVYMDPEQAGNTVVPAEAALVLESGEWYTMPLADLDTPRFGFAIHADDVVLHGGSPELHVSPEIDPIVATIRELAANRGL